MTPEKARSRGVYAAHEKVIPLCPFSSIYEPAFYNAWYDGIADELRRLNTVVICVNEQEPNRDVK